MGCREGTGEEETRRRGDGRRGDLSVDLFARVPGEIGRWIFFLCVLRARANAGEGLTRESTRLTRTLVVPPVRVSEVGARQVRGEMAVAVLGETGGGDV